MSHHSHPHPYTPGPWRVGTNHPAELFCTAEGVRVADCSTNTRPEAEQEANARLMAAAPELVEALTAALGSLPHEVRRGVAQLLAAATRRD